MNWEPARADHSIERATATITLMAPPDANLFDELIVAGRKVGASHNLSNRIDLMDPITIMQPPAGKIEFNQLLPMPPTMPPRRVVFRRLDTDGVSVDELSIGMQQIAIGTLRYQRWADFYGLLTASVTALQQIYPIIDNVRTARLEYVDRFQSIPGGADHFEVIRRDSSFITPAVNDKRAALHVHSGWFDFENAETRLLTNINIDVTDLTITASSDGRSNVSILCLGQHEALTGCLASPMERMERLHDYLKSIFGRIITPEAAARVALND